MVTIKANDWLLAQGHISEIKRGRRSAENTARLAAAHAEGQRFSDWEPAETVNKSGETVIKNVSRGATSEIENYSQEFVRFDGGDDKWIVREVVSGKIRSIRSACMGCGYSLVGHICAETQPLIVGTGSQGAVRVNITLR